MNPEWHRLRIGGVFRCCIQNLAETRFERAPEEGNEIECPYCHGGLVFFEGAWEWAGSVRRKERI